MGKTRSVATILDAARALAGVCDGAVSRDAQGFNGADSTFAKSLLEQAYLTTRQLAALHRLLAKYAGQLARIGFAYSELVVPGPGPVPGARQAGLQVHSTPSMSSLSGPRSDPLPPARPAEASLKREPWKPRLPWTLSTAELVGHFPDGMTPRPKQLEALADINEKFRSGKRVVVLEMPTGGGKSPICLTVARAVKAMEGKTHFLTIQKALQDQYTRDFPAPQLEVLKGRANYGCSLEADRHCGDAPCTDKKKGILRDCVSGGDDNETLKRAVQLQLSPEAHRCPYWRQLQLCHDSAVTLFNFSSFLFQQRIGRFGKRDLMLVDEAHNIEGQLINFVSLELTEWTLSIIGVKVDREISSKANLMDWLRENAVLSKVDKLLNHKGDSGPGDESFEEELDKVEAEALQNLKMKLENFLRFVETSEWIFETVEYTDKRGEPAKKILARPLFAKQFAEDLLFSRADRVLVMSATILDVRLWAENLGLDPESVGLVQTPCDFLVANRPIHLEYAGNMGRKYFSREANPRDPTRPKFAAKVRQILDRHAGQRGIVHCQSHELARVIREDVRDSRLIFQDDFRDKDEMLVAHRSRSDSVLVSPGVKEGFDFRDDMARFQIIAKVPWPSLGDKIVKERAARSDRYYGWLTALGLVQSYGRIVRSKDDWGVTYIVDSGFEFFVSKHGSMLPVWFREAFRKAAPREVRR